MTITRNLAIGSASWLALFVSACVSTMPYEHPFKEYHEDAAIGNLMWRIDRLSDAAFFSQDGSTINALEKNIQDDHDELSGLLAAYNERVKGASAPPM